MSRYTFAALLTTVSTLAVVACNKIDIDLEQTQNKGCCCNTCGSCGCDGGDGGTGGGTTTTTSTTTTSTTTTSTTDACICPQGYQVTPAGDACFRETHVDPVQNAVTYNVCHGEVSPYYGQNGAIVEPGGLSPGGTTESNPYWGEINNVPPYTGRLNDVGVWACAPTEPDWLPTNEWIGFTVCLDLQEAGDYVIGVAADNELEVKIDGALIYTATSAMLDAFTYWHLVTRNLSSGPHRVELRALNTWDIAAFGAEISGPFPVGSLNTDAAVLDEAAYDSHLVFSTGSLTPATTFALGENSGWSCPGQAALDLCAAQPTCTTIDYQPCHDPGETGMGGRGGGIDPSLR